jgi:hypothetical protein
MLSGWLNTLFGCSHRKTTFPLTPGRALGINALRAQTYVVCLDCGREFEYDWDKMRIRKSVSMLIPTRVQEKPLGTL